MRPKGRSWFCACVALVVLACERGAPSLEPEEAGGRSLEPAGAVGASPKGVLAASASGASGGSGSEVPSLTRRAAPSGVSCRVMSVSGAAQRDGLPLRAGDTLDRQQAVELGAGSTLHLVHTASARQWTLTGPARAFACERGAEEIVLARGRLRTEPGSGVRPGAEVWVGTPFGSLRYSDARAELEVTPEALRVQVSRGSVWLSPLGDEAPERELTAAATTFPARRYRLASAAATARCESAARAAEALATALLSPSTEPLGMRAREHVRARQRAHASCSSALATLLAGDAAGAQDPPTQAGYSALAEADRLWRGVPARSPPPP
jgi:hypothetical protein